MTSSNNLKNAGPRERTNNPLTAVCSSRNVSLTSPGRGFLRNVMLKTGRVLTTVSPAAGQRSKGVSATSGRRSSQWWAVGGLCIITSSRSGLLRHSVNLDCDSRYECIGFALDSGFRGCGGERRGGVDVRQSACYSISRVGRFSMTASRFIHDSTAIQMRRNGPVAPSVG